MGLQMAVSRTLSSIDDAIKWLEEKERYLKDHKSDLGTIYMLERGIHLDDREIPATDWPKFSGQPGAFRAYFITSD